MKIFLKVKTRAKKTEVEKIGENHFIVSVTEPPVKGEANKAVIKALADYFDTSPSNIFLVSGIASPQKIFEILE